jgi:chaperonin GroES
MSFRPLHDRVVVRRLAAEERTAGGIIIPDTVKEKPQQAIVVGVGPGSRNDRGELVPLDVRAGDKVLFAKWSGTDVLIDGEEMLILKESEILGIVDESASSSKMAA